MAIDLASLEQASAGPPEAKMQVTKAWLAEVHQLLLAGVAAERRAGRLEAEARMHSRMADIGAELFGTRHRKLF